MKPTFYLCLLGMTLLFATLWQYEMASKHTSMQLRVAAAQARRRRRPSPPRGRTAAPTM